MAHRLSRLQRRILGYVYAAQARSGWHVTPSYVELVRALDGNKGNVSTSVRNLEAKGLIEVYRTQGGQTTSIWLTPMGKNRASVSTKSFD